MRYILYPLAIIILYRFLVHFVIPMFQVTKMASQRLRQMQSQMNDMQEKMKQPPQDKPQQVKEGDYIDYEEVK